MKNKEFLSEVKVQSELKSYPALRCELCDTIEGIYICEHGHELNGSPRCFCKPCLMGTKRVGDHRVVFKAKCERPDCNFIPMNDNR